MNLAAPLAGVLSCINLSHACCGGGRGAWGGRRNRAEEENRLALDCEPGACQWRFQIYLEASAVRLPPHITSALLRPAPVPHCGENGISPNWPVESWWDPRHVPGRVLADGVPWVRLDSSGFCGKTGSGRGWVSVFFAAVCPGKCGVPPGRCPPCPTLSQSKRCAVSSCTRLRRPRGRLVFRPICGVHAVRCLGCVF